MKSDQLEIPRVVLGEIPAPTLHDDQLPLIDFIDNILPGTFVLDKKAFKAFSSKGLRGIFTVDKRLEEGREGGVHNTYFGYGDFSSMRDQTVSIDMAVKPFRGELEPYSHQTKRSDSSKGDPQASVAYESAATASVQALFDHQATFQRLGLWRSNDGIIQYVTRFNRSVVTLNNIFYTKPERVSAVTSEQILRAAHIGMRILGVLAGGNSVHQDFLVQNAGRNHGEFEFSPDNETVKMLETNRWGNTADSTSNKNALQRDIQNFYGSMVSPSKTPEQIAQKVFTLLDNPIVIKSLVATYNKGVIVAEQATDNTLPDSLTQTPSILGRLITSAMIKSRAYFEVKKDRKL